MVLVGCIGSDEGKTGSRYPRESGLVLVVGAGFVPSRLSDSFSVAWLDMNTG